MERALVATDQLDPFTDQLEPFFVVLLLAVACHGSISCEEW
jgi:hypothetical protein